MVAETLATTYGEKGQSWRGWIVQLFPDYVVWSTDYRSDGKLMKQSYTVSDTGATLDGKPVEVVRKVTYSPVTNVSVTNQNEETSTMPFDKKAHLDSLIANGVGKGTRVGVLMTNRPEFLSAAQSVFPHGSATDRH